VAFVGDLAAASERLQAEVRPGDFVLTLGAGSVWHAGDELLRWIERG
jgi:UDP-N-acetylmuramate-alanine ligase